MDALPRQAGRQALPPYRHTLSPTLPFGSTEVSPPVSSLEGDPRASSPEGSRHPQAERRAPALPMDGRPSHQLMELIEPKFVFY